MKVMIALSNMLFSEGVGRLLEGTEALRAIEPLRPEESPSETIGSFGPDVIIVDFTALYNRFSEGDFRDSRFLLLDTGCGDDNIISAVLTRGLKGVLSGNASVSELKKAVKAVAKGEVWLDKVNLRSLLAGIHAINRPHSPLTGREWEVVRLVGHGCRNKEIAERLCISEPTVKAHLQRIFHKLDIHNRPQLVSYAIKNQNGP